MELRAPSAPLIEEPRPRRWTRGEYHALGELGWFERQRVELIEGTILEMSPQREPHFQAILLVLEALRDAFGSDHTIRPQGPLAILEVSEPEPDIAVVAGSPRSYSEHPTTALLIVEVSGSSLRYDRGEKASLYARAGIQDYWILNLVDQRLEVRRDPVRDDDQPHGFRYADTRILDETDTISPLASPEARVPVRDLLPG